MTLATSCAPMSSYETLKDKKKRIARLIEAGENLTQGDVEGFFPHELPCACNFCQECRRQGRFFIGHRLAGY